jgi:two-component system invasion response regulator UvrY
MIRILIADDHPVVLEGLKHLVAGAPDLEVAGTASTGQEAIEKLRKSHWDVVLLDISMAGMDGLETLKQIRRMHPGLPVLVLSVHAPEQYAVRAMRDGAAGYLDKGISGAELVLAIRRAAAGGKYVTQEVAELLASVVSDDAVQPPHGRLSDRELEVLLKLTSGKPLTEIASELSVSTKTVSTYRARILEKLRLRNTAEIVSYAFQHGLHA